MPLKEGSGRETISKNIGEIMKKYKEKKKIGNIKPKSTVQAQKIAAAIAYKKSRE